MFVSPFCFDVVESSKTFWLVCPGAEIGRQAWLRAMCPLGRAGSSPALGTSIENLPLSQTLQYSLIFFQACLYAIQKRICN